MIARNEERMLPDCLESVRGVVDEIVLVDTGSTDGTKAVALRHGARVYDRPWDDDFSAPRNLSIAEARGDWILQLDADERLARGSGAVIRRALRSAEKDLFVLKLHDASRLDATEEEVLGAVARIGDPTLVPRLMRRTPDLEYRGVVHESVEDWLVRHGYRLGVLEAHIVHLGAVLAHRAALGKRGRNVGLLEKRCRQEPDSIVPFGYLAMEYWHCDRFEDARRAVEEGWKLLDAQPKHRSAHLLAVARALSCGRVGDLPEMLHTVERVVAREGLQSDTGFLRGWALERMGQAEAGARRSETLERAAAAYREVVEARARSDERVLIEGSPSWLTRLRLGTTLLLLGRPDEALPELEAVPGSAPVAEEAGLARAEARLEMGEVALARTLLEPLLAERPDAWVLAAAAEARAGSGGEARRLLTGARERARKGFVAPHRAHRLQALVRALASSAEESAELLAALMARRAPPDRLHAAELDVGYLRRVAKDFLPAGRADLLVPLLEPSAEVACPGLPARMRSILAELGAEVVEHPDRPR